MLMHFFSQEHFDKTFSLKKCNLIQFNLVKIQKQNRVHLAISDGIIRVRVVKDYRLITHKF